MSHMPQARFQDRTRVDLPLTLPWLCPRPASGLLTRQRSALTLEEAGEPLLLQPWGGGGGDAGFSRTTSPFHPSTRHSSGNLGLRGVNSGSSGLPLPLLPAAPATIASPINHFHLPIPRNVAVS